VLFEGERGAFAVGQRVVDDVDAIGDDEIHQRSQARFVDLERPVKRRDHRDVNAAQRLAESRIGQHVVLPF